MLLLLRRLLFRYFLKPRRRSSVNIPSFMPLQHVCRAGRKEGKCTGTAERSSHSWPWSIERSPRSTAATKHLRRARMKIQVGRWYENLAFHLIPATATYESISPFRSLTHAAHARQTAIRNRSDNDQFHPRSITHYIRGGKGNGRSQVSAKLLLRIIMR